MSFEQGSPEWWAEMDELVKNETGWDNLADMCRNEPTLRPPLVATLKQLAVCVELRRAFKFVTGRDAYGDAVGHSIEGRYLRALRKVS